MKRFREKSVVIGAALAVSAAALVKGDGIHNPFNDVFPITIISNGTDTLNAPLSQDTITGEERGGALAVDYRPTDHTDPRS